MAKYTITIYTVSKKILTVFGANFSKLKHNMFFYNFWHTLFRLYVLLKHVKIFFRNLFVSIVDLIMIGVIENAIFIVSEVKKSKYSR